MQLNTKCNSELGLRVTRMYLLYYSFFSYITYDQILSRMQCIFSASSLILII